MDGGGNDLEQALEEGDVYWALEAFYQQEEHKVLWSAQDIFYLLVCFLEKTQGLVLSEVAHTKTRALKRPHYSFSEASDEFFYARMRITRLLLEKFFKEGFLKNDAATCFGFLKGLLREYSIDQWGNLESVSVKEAKEREQILHIVFSQPCFFACGFSFDESLELLKRFAFERDNIYSFLCQSGVFDQALTHDHAKTQDMLLISLTGKQQQSVSSAHGLFVSNLINRSFLLKRAVFLGVVCWEDCKNRHFSLLDITWDKACVTKDLMEQGMRLPVLESDVFRLSPIYTVEQLKTWAFYDSKGMMQQTLSSNGTHTSFYFFMENLRKVCNIFFGDKSRFSSWEEEREEIETTLFGMWQGIWAKQGRLELCHALNLSKTDDQDTDEAQGKGGKKRM